jgi:hypothetical protein
MNEQTMSRVVPQRGKERKLWTERVSEITVTNISETHIEIEP